MGYKRLPVEVCGPQHWPGGPFEPTGSPADDDGLAAAAATVGRLAAALMSRRQEYGWSRARLARQSGVGQHAIGRIETGRTWPDLATVARLAQTLHLSITIDGAGASAGVASSAGRVGASAGAVSGGLAGSGGQPLSLGSATSAAQVIEALFARDQRLAGEVATLRRNRLRAGPGGGSRGEGRPDAEPVRVNATAIGGIRL